MERLEQLAQILAVVRAQVRGVSQVERTMMITCDGLEAALDHLYGDTLFAAEEAVNEARKDVQRWLDQGLRVVSILEADYPHALATIHQAPALLFYEGVIQPCDEGVAIVGSRDITPRQEQIARAVASHIAQRGLSVVSGLAAGVDSVAHWQALAEGVRTVAVMGTSIEKTYPRENTALREKIVDNGGLIISQFLPGANVGKYAFPMRNVTMSGYSRCTIIVAATEKSGTRHQAFAAHHHGRPVILLDHVVETASWARDLTSRPGVFVVAGLDELDARLTKLEHQRQMLELSIEEDRCA